MKICVYGASSYKIDKSYIEAGELLGEIMGKRGHSLIFGGGDSGMMGAVARGVAKYKGEIVGVAPKFFQVDGVLYDKCSEFIYTDTMRERKQVMEDRADGFVVTPGGIGTFEEFFEILTLKQLNRHNKPIAILNTNGYYDSLQQMMKDAIDREFVGDNCVLLYEFLDTPEQVVEYIEKYDFNDVIDIRKLKNIRLDKEEYEK